MEASYVFPAHSDFCASKKLLLLVSVDDMSSNATYKAKIDWIIFVCIITQFPHMIMIKSVTILFYNLTYTVVMMDGCYQRRALDLFLLGLPNRVSVRYAAVQ